MSDTFFSAEELEVLRNRRFFEVKNAAIERLRATFEAIRETMRPSVQDMQWLCAGSVDVNKGYLVNAEDYLSLPYVVMDYPKHLSRQELMAYRVLFWWSHYAEFTLILQGEWLSLSVKRLAKRLDAFAAAGIEASTANDPWDNRCGEGHTRSLRNDEETREWLRDRPFLKLMRWLPSDAADFSPGRIHAMGVETWELYAPLVTRD